MMVPGRIPHPHVSHLHLTQLEHFDSLLQNNSNNIFKKNQSAFPYNHPSLTNGNDPKSWVSLSFTFTVSANSGQEVDVETS
jgi:hypothetical protein